MTITRKSAIAMVFSCLLASGCGHSFLSDRETNPIIVDNTVPNIFGSTVDVFGTTASRRMVLIVKQHDKKNQNGLGAIVTCAEPPPDVGEAFAAALATGLRGAITASQGTDTTIGAEVAGKYAKQTATQIAPLIFRTQGLQMYRDTQYSLCVDRINNVITSNEEYLAIKEKRYQEAIDLIRDELPLMKDIAIKYYESVKVGKAELSVEDMVKIMEANKQEINLDTNKK